jgi:hypothetical protein
MDLIESIIGEYVNLHGTPREKDILPIYQGKYLEVFSKKDSDLEESLEFGGGETLLFVALVFILETVAKSILQDGYKLSKDKILSYLKKDKNKIQKKLAPKELALTTETIEKMIVLLEAELEHRKGEGQSPPA